MQNVTTAIIPIAGLGTRFLPATKAIPKEFFPILDKPALQLVIEEAISSEIKRILLVISPLKGDPTLYFNPDSELEKQLTLKNQLHLLSSVHAIRSSAKIETVVQTKPAGLGHAILTAAPLLKKEEPFAVLLPDDLYLADPPCLRQLLDLSAKRKLPAIALLEVPPQEVSKYGIAQVNQLNKRTYRIERLVEKPKISEAPSHFALPGRYVVTHEIFRFLRKVRPGRGGEIQFTDALNEYAKEVPLLGYLIHGRRFDVGDICGYIEANVAYALIRPETGEQLRHNLRALLADE
ncbi:MAG: UTP--glucose-1-phosphate uridylyltransferase [Deltaproteobacteria bacterium]|nr:UTP--glucose-1-phosphate uridylyltransferase [Deltaproteobacteria bacterium]